MRRVYEMGNGFIDMDNIFEDAKKNVLIASTRKLINRKLSGMGSYFNKIPIKEIIDILDHFGIKVLQEDNTEFEGMLVGNNSHTTFPIAYAENVNYETESYIPIENSMLYLSWYKMNTGRYDCVMYLS